MTDVVTFTVEDAEKIAIDIAMSRPNDQRFVKSEWCWYIRQDGQWRRDGRSLIESIAACTVGYAAGANRVPPDVAMDTAVKAARKVCERLTVETAADLPQQEEQP
jgi:hypothetical protein